ncbi:hypothetical protein AAMO2058_001157200 [Amorphochlora amoebiformis]
MEHEVESDDERIPPPLSLLSSPPIVGPGSAPVTRVPSRSPVDHGARTPPPGRTVGFRVYERRAGNGIKDFDKSERESETSESDENNRGGAKAMVEGVVQRLRGGVGALYEDWVDISYSIPRNREGHRILTLQAEMLKTPLEVDTPGEMTPTIGDSEASHGIKGRNLISGKASSVSLLEAQPPSIIDSKCRLHFSPRQTAGRFYEKRPHIYVREGRNPRNLLRTSASQPLFPSPFPNATENSIKRAKQRKDRQTRIQSATTPFLPPSMTLPTLLSPAPPRPNGPPPSPPYNRSTLRKLWSWGRGQVGTVSNMVRRSKNETDPPNAGKKKDRDENVLPASRIDSAVRILREGLNEHESNILNLQQERAKIKQDLWKEMRRWEKYALSDLHQTAQRVVTIRMIEISAQLDVEFEFSHALMNAMNRLQALHVNQKSQASEDLVAFVSRLEKGEQADSLVMFPDMDHKLEEMRRLKAESEELQKLYEKETKERTVKDTFSGRKQKLKHAIEQDDDKAEWNADYGRYWRPSSASNQLAFHSLMLDERQSEGQLIRRWRALLNAAISVSADAVRTFFKHIIRQIALRYTISNERNIAALHLAMCR